MCGGKKCSEVCGYAATVGYSSCLIDPSFASQSYGYVSRLWRLASRLLQQRNVVPRWYIEYAIAVWSSMRVGCGGAWSRVRGCAPPNRMLLVKCALVLSKNVCKAPDIKSRDGCLLVYKPVLSR